MKTFSISMIAISILLLLCATGAESQQEKQTVPKTGTGAEWSGSSGDSDFVFAASYASFRPIVRAVTVTVSANTSAADVARHLKDKWNREYPDYQVSICSSNDKIVVFNALRMKVLTPDLDLIEVETRNKEVGSGTLKVKGVNCP